MSSYGLDEESGDGGLATMAQMSNVQSLALDGAGNIYFADVYAERIRERANNS
jgi:hypothetical protein